MGKSTNNGNCDFPYGKHFIVQSKKQSSNIFGFTKMAVEALIEGSQNGSSYLRFGIRHTNREELVYDIAYYLYRVMAGLIDNGVSNIQLTAGQSGSFSDLRALVLDILNCNVADKLVQNVPGEIKAA